MKLSEWAYLRASSRSHCIQKIADFQDFLEPLRFRLSRWSATIQAVMGSDGKWRFAHKNGETY